MTEKLIGIEDLPDNFKVYLDDNFRKELIKQAVKNAGGFIKLSKELSFDWSSLCKLRRGYRIINGRKSSYFIKINLLKKLIKITNFPITDIERYVEGIAFNKVLVKTKLPLVASKELASIVGHVLGDGTISVDRFRYVNERKELIDEVETFAKNVFGHGGRKFPYKTYHVIDFPGIIGRLLSLVGAPLGRKTTQILTIPSWIKNGNSEIKVSFLRAIFDDEGCVPRCKYRFISVSMAKQNKLIKSHIKFLEEIKELLNDLAIKSTKTYFKNSYKDKKIFEFRIYGIENLYNFSKSIGFTHKLKSRKLIKIIQTN